MIPVDNQAFTRFTPCPFVNSSTPRHFIDQHNHMHPNDSVFLPEYSELNKQGRSIGTSQVSKCQLYLSVVYQSLIITVLLKRSASLKVYLLER